MPEARPAGMVVCKQQMLKPDKMQKLMDVFGGPDDRQLVSRFVAGSIQCNQRGNPGRVHLRDGGEIQQQRFFSRTGQKLIDKCGFAAANKLAGRGDFGDGARKLPGSIEE